MLQQRDGGEDGRALASSDADREAITRAELKRRATNAGDECLPRAFTQCMDAMAISLPTVGSAGAAMNPHSATRPVVVHRKS